MAVAAMQGDNQHIRSSLGFSILQKDTSTWRPGELNQWPSDNNLLDLALSHSRRGMAEFHILKQSGDSGREKNWKKWEMCILLLS